jgi:predicted secreted hydrolase
MNRDRLTANLGRAPKGAEPAVDVVADLPFKKNFNINSWFAIGHFEVEGHTLNYLVHLMAGRIGGVTLGVYGGISVTDETTGWFAGQDVLYPSFRGTLRSDRFCVKAPNCSMEGDLDQLRIRAEMRDVSIDVTLAAVGQPLYNKGTGVFDMLGMRVHQYSLPTMATHGRLTVDGRPYAVEGTSWFDRQWQKQPVRLPGKWTWMDLNLDNGWRISLWDAVDKRGTSTAWVTAVDSSGAHTVVDLVPLREDADEYWLSPGGNRFPTRWRVRIPSLDADLVVVPAPREQEVRGLLARYEGASSVVGHFGSEAVKGYCYVEMVGDWKA